jgi:hypothetical protein
MIRVPEPGLCAIVGLKGSSHSFKRRSGGSLVGLFCASCYYVIVDVHTVFFLLTIEPVESGT